LEDDNCLYCWRDKKNNIKIYIEQGWKMTIVYTVGEISNNNIKIYTEQGWKMTSVYTVGEVSNNNINIYT
jgi:wyosine [tRNA(Phe)-imidazoG37] synthetase (radical SAM superfamily)